MANKVNKSFLTRKISRVNQVPLRDASACVDVLIDSIAEELSKGERIELRGLGTFCTKKIEGRNINLNGVSLTVSSHRKIVFRPSQKLKEAVRNIDC